MAKGIFIHLSEKAGIPGQAGEDAGTIPQGGSKFWGSPDLPEGAEWPVFGEEEWQMDFICQVNLADIASLDPEGKLPQSGLLLFFADIAHYLGWDAEPGITGVPSDTDAVKVIYVPEGTPLETQILTDEDGDEVCLEELAMSFSSEPGLEEHALLPPPDHREWEDWDAPCQGWEILLQVDSFGPVEFCDEGLLEFLIAPEDLAARDFSRVRAIVLST